MVYVFIIFLVIVLLALSVVTTTDNTMLLFGHMTHAEVNREADNCHSFLEVFYRDSYMIKLKSR